jgi:hypothetical protein
LFVRTQTNGSRTYLLIVDNEWVDGKVKQRVLHRLFAPGSDRAAEKWKDGYAIEGVAGLELQHLYRAMAWLGEVLPEAEHGDIESKERFPHLHTSDYYYDVRYPLENRTGKLQLSLDEKNGAGQVPKKARRRALCS